MIYVEIFECDIGNMVSTQGMVIDYRAVSKRDPDMLLHSRDYSVALYVPLAAVASYVFGQPEPDDDTAQAEQEALKDSCDLHNELGLGPWPPR